MCSVVGCQGKCRSQVFAHENLGKSQPHMARVKVTRGSNRWLHYVAQEGFRHAAWSKSPPAQVCLPLWSYTIMLLVAESHRIPWIHVSGEGVHRSYPHSRWALRGAKPSEETTASEKGWHSNVAFATLRKVLWNDFFNCARMVKGFFWRCLHFRILRVINLPPMNM